MFQQSMTQLKIVQQKYQESQESLNKLTPQSAKQDILVPLTTSVSFFMHHRDDLDYTTCILALT